MSSFQKTISSRNPSINWTAAITTSRFRALHWVYLLLSCSLLPTTAAWAQTKPTTKDSAAIFGGFVGLGVNAAPRYQGSDEYITTGVPGFEYHWANGLFVGGGDGLIGVQMSATSQMQLGVALGEDEGRKEADSRHLIGMGDIQPRGTINVYAKATVDEQLGFNTGMQLGGGSSGNGGLIKLGVSYGLPLASATRISIQAGATVANSAYMQDYFGVSAAQASTSGYKRYTPNAGLRDVALGLSLEHKMSREWVMIANITTTSLSHSAKDSPLVRKAISQSAYAALAYSF